MKKRAWVAAVVLVAVAVGGVVLSQIQKSKNFICEGKREWMYTSKDAKYDLGNEFVDFNIPIKIFYKLSIIDFNYKIDNVIFDFEIVRDISENTEDNYIFMEENEILKISKNISSNPAYTLYSFEIDTATGAFRESDFRKFKDKDAYISSNGVCEIVN